MLSVDLAGIQLLERLNQNRNITWTLFNTEAQGSIVYGDRDCIVYKLLDDLRLLENFDRVVFWGDFAHWLLYATQEWVPRTMRRLGSMSEAEGMNKWFHLFFLGGAERLLQKVIVFGSTLYGLTAKQLAVGAYYDSLQSMYGSCRAAMPRDFYSAVFINQLVGANNAVLGCDCAFFLDDAKLLSTLGKECHGISTIIAEGKALPLLVCAIGRTQSASLLSYFSSLVANRMGASIVFLPWLANNGIHGLCESLDLLSRSSYVITDIYHCAVSSLRLGKSTIAFGSTSPSPTHSLSDKKKEILFRQHLIGHNYVATERVSQAVIQDSSLGSLVDEVVGLLQDKLSVETANALLKTHVDSSSNLLQMALVTD
ncbi:polysaccharide pyruvyl transferase family protein [Synechococcus sp. CCY9202]|uniref:polysaccharide pyruvyl transferase family protein n=1 Tax=Synechococcus sp. CCY9202 TaxID=174698 RepID=UPI002B200D7E|nr:polysaccharide pyruvyl transferase family protein [Synechococcus sp. CCY9202]MEA5424483.1 polysaccharide pyruvyl transferase family protein [Synechococcus sp. CCY9202]